MERSYHLQPCRRAERDGGGEALVGDLDRNQIEYVLVNVLKNAMESIGEDGRIVLRLVSDGERPVLTISDTGPGIPEEVRGRSSSLPSSAPSATAAAWGSP